MWRPLPLLLVAWTLGCGDATERDHRPPPASAPKPDPAAGTGPTVTRNADGTFDVHATGQPRARVLDALADAAGFGIVPGRGSPAPRPLTLRLERASVDAAIRGVLRGIPHHLHYERRTDGGPVELRRVTLGLLPPPEARGEGRARLGQRLLERRRILAERTPEDLEQ
ncbi:MAG: hypothetical protein OEP95_16065, partial [Myxococcales bacterium]|nr:hypothetical protein [Myxococcales bacterium]